MKVFLPIIWHELTHCIRDAWEAAGHEVRVYDWRTEHRRKGRDRMLAAMVDEVRKWQPDLVWMQIQAPNIMTPAACEVMRQNCGYLAHWSGDVRHPLPQWYLQVAPHVDCLLFSNLTDVDIVRDKGYPSAHLQIGYDPRLYYPGSEQREGIVFIGNNYGGYKYAESESRRELVRAMADAFPDSFKAYGLGWDKVVPPKNNGGYIREPGDADILRRSLIALNWDHFNRRAFYSDRLLRGMACGCKVVDGRRCSGWDIAQMVEICKASMANRDGTLNSGSVNAENALLHGTWDSRVARMVQIMNSEQPEPDKIWLHG